MKLEAGCPRSFYCWNSSEDLTVLVQFQLKLISARRCDIRGQRSTDRYVRVEDAGEQKLVGGMYSKGNYLAGRI